MIDKQVFYNLLADNVADLYKQLGIAKGEPNTLLLDLYEELMDIIERYEEHPEGIYSYNKDIMDCLREKNYIGVAFCYSCACESRVLDDTYSMFNYRTTLEKMSKFKDVPELLKLCKKDCTFDTDRFDLLAYIDRAWELIYWKAWELLVKPLKEHVRD